MSLVQESTKALQQYYVAMFRVNVFPQSHRGSLSVFIVHLMAIFTGLSIIMNTPVLSTAIFSTPSSFTTVLSIGFLNRFSLSLYDLEW